MNIPDFLIFYIIIPIFVLTILVFVHEWGHFWVARRNNVKVEVFSIGFGPELFGFNDKYGTRWKFSSIPLGGYVKMFGEMGNNVNDTKNQLEITEEEKLVSFQFKTLGQRAAIVAAGPIVNFIFAIFAFAILASVIGTTRPLAGVGKVLPESAAEQAGFQNGDKIFKIENQKVIYFDDVREIVQKNPNIPLLFYIDRNGTDIILTATPKSSDPTNLTSNNKTNRGILGIELNQNYFETVRKDPITAIWFGFERTIYFSINILEYVLDIFFKGRTTDDLGGPLRIAEISGDMAQKGPEQLLFLMAILSVNLGLINLFPIPMLDGGHLMFYAIEGLLGRPLGQRLQDYSFRIGLILVMTLFVFIIGKDIVHFFNKLS